MNKFILLFLIVIIGAFLRFYKLDWGEGIYTHPDEYHIAAAVNQLSFPHQMHPHFFSYGTVTIYLIYFTKEFLAFLNSQFSTPIESGSIFLIGRFYSAFFSTLTILLLYKISSLFFKKSWALLSALLVAITPGLIQQAHFATPESNLIFFLFGSLLFLLYFFKNGKIRFLFFASLFLGFALGAKISALVFLLPVLAGIILQSFRKPLRLILLAMGSLIITIAMFAFVAPYAFLDFPAFLSNIQYEGNLARGAIPVFYTRQFIDTIPILFQLQHVFPFALGPSVLLSGILGFFLTCIIAIKKRSLLLTILVLSFLSIFLTNGFLFAKWTRFIAPAFPFLTLFSAFFLFHITTKNKTVGRILTGILLTTTIIWTYAFFSIYTNRDVRITASKWLVSNVVPQSVILIEGGNTIDIPLEGNFQRVGFDFYNFEENQNIRTEIAAGLERADYFLLQSRRVFMNHQKAKKQFPKTALFYDLLFAGNLGFTQIKEFHSYPKISIGTFSIEFPDEQAEETWSVFDHPVIRVFKKTKVLPKEMYAKIVEE